MATVATSRSSFSFLVSLVRVSPSLRRNSAKARAKEKERIGAGGEAGGDAVTSTGVTERDGMIIGKGDGGERIGREMPMERTGNLMRNRGSRGPSGGRGGAGDGGRGRGSRGRWLPWLPETAVAATDDARGVTDSWQSYRVPTRTGCVSIYVTYTYMYTHAKHTYTCSNTHAATDRYV